MTVLATLPQVSRCILQVHHPDGKEITLIQGLTPWPEAVVSANYFAITRAFGIYPFAYESDEDNHETLCSPLRWPDVNACCARLEADHVSIPTHCP